MLLVQAERRHLLPSGVIPRAVGWVQVQHKGIITIFHKRRNRQRSECRIGVQVACHCNVTACALYIPSMARVLVSMDGQPISQEMELRKERFPALVFSYSHLLLNGMFELRECIGLGDLEKMDPLAGPSPDGLP